jgi:hypothetical protein
MSSKIAVESWNFHGFMSGDKDNEVIEFIDSKRVYKFAEYNFWNMYNEGRVNRMGWPVSRYKMQVVTEEEAEALKAMLKFDSFYKVYREI